KTRLLAAHLGLPAAAIEIVVIRTSGDRIQDRPLAEAGGKGLFTKELEEALLERRIDLAVHSMKDMPTLLPADLVIGALLPREDPRDALIAPTARRLAELPQGAVVGTASLRRQAQVRFRRPDLRVVPFRGNVETRLRKLGEGQADATLLALAGLKRLGLAGRAAGIIEPEEMLPAVAQGAIGLQCRAEDAATREQIAALDHAPTAVCIEAERAMLAVLDGSCRTPIAGLAQPGAGGITLRGMVLRPDGSEAIEAVRSGRAEDAAALGGDLGAELKARAGADYFTVG
ncbi:MAG TPA: hydroxymethylbilane synthase, partial [Candidatus Sulfotelmatobacter sp.]|nr:hydroxymethylbilane synthase [Candidatus Sulfotelmatobacter sp.]